MKLQLIPWWLVLLLIPACLWLGSLAGCATQGDYWVKVREPLPVKEIRFVEYPCGRTDLNGCSRLAEGILEIKTGRSFSRSECTRTHELKHFAGYDHPDFNYTTLATDCGNGKVIP